MTAVALPFLLSPISLKLSDWARKQGISYLTAWRWFKAGKLPVPAIQLPTGTILVQERVEGTTVLYARVSGHDQKDDLRRQVERLLAWVLAQGIEDYAVVEEIGSGLNGRRRKLLRVLRNPRYTRSVVEHRDRLAPLPIGETDLRKQVAFPVGETHLRKQEEGEVKEDLVRDVLELLTSVAGRLYGWRSARNRAQRALAALGEGA
ncbi:IS607-like element IS1602 family transposase [Thermus oshimai]